MILLSCKYTPKTIISNSFDGFAFDSNFALNVQKKNIAQSYGVFAVSLGKINIFDGIITKFCFYWVVDEAH